MSDPDCKHETVKVACAACGAEPDVIKVSVPYPYRPDRIGPVAVVFSLCALVGLAIGWVGLANGFVGPTVYFGVLAAARSTRTRQPGWFIVSLVAVAAAIVAGFVSFLVKYPL